MSLTFRRLSVALAAGALLMAGCSSSDKSGGTAEGPPEMKAATAVGDGEGELNIIAWAGYAENGSNDPAVDWVHAVRAGNRLQGQRQDRQHLRRDGSADANRPVRRGVRVRRRHAAADLRRRRGPGEHRSGAQLRHHLRRS